MVSNFQTKYAIRIEAASIHAMAWSRQGQYLIFFRSPTPAAPQAGFALRGQLAGLNSLAGRFKP